MAIKQTKGYIEQRINRLKMHSVENARLIKKWERKLRKAQKDEVSVS